MNRSLKETGLRTYLRLLEEAKKYWLFFAFGLIGTIIATGTDAGLAWAVKPIIDKGLVGRDRVFLEFLPLLIIIAFFIRGGAFFVSNYFITKVGRSVVMNFRQKIFSHLLHLPASFYDQETSGKLISLLLYNTEQVAVASTEAVLTVLQEGLTLIGLVLVMFIISWKMTLLFMMAAPIVFLVVHFNSKRLRSLSSSVQSTMSEITHIAEEGIEGYRVIRIFGGEKYEKAKFIKATILNRHREMKVVVTNALGTSITQIVAALPIAVIIYIATLPSVYISVGTFGAIIAAMLRLLTPMRRLTKINTDIQKGIAGAHSIFDLLDAKVEHDQGYHRVKRVRGEIEYRNVSFSYPRSKKEILHEINLTINAGQKIALVGKSGGGKSTLVSLLPRFYEVSLGEIFIDQVNVRDYLLSDLRKQFALVSQNLTLFNDTIANNIAYGDLHNIDREKILKVAEAAHLDFVKQLPDGLDTLIGENGILLSGGQRQRIAIARALLKDAPILILDEATSSLDTESEFHIQEALRGLMQNRTTLIIAHRLSTVERADRIIVIEKGRIVEIGTHTELLSRHGIYAKLHKMQFKNT
jgi:ATP-binding cassette, subfamily B, bacterial MsbA